VVLFTIRLLLILSFYFFLSLIAVRIKNSLALWPHCCCGAPSSSRGYRRSERTGKLHFYTTYYDVSVDTLVLRH